MQAHRREMVGHRSDIAASNRSRERPGDAEGTSVRQRLLGEAPVDRQGTLLIKPSDRSELDDRIEEGDETTSREDGCGVIRRLRAWRQSDRGGADGLGHLREQGRQLVVTLDRNGGATKRLDRAFDISERNERVKRPDLGSGRHRRLENLSTERPGGVHESLPAIEPQAARDAGEGVVRDRQDDQVHGVNQRGGFGECSGSRHIRLEPRATYRITGRDGADRPARPRQGRAEGTPNRAAADNPDDGWIARGRMNVGMRVGMVSCTAVVIGIVVSMPVTRRVQVDTSFRELAQRLIDTCPSRIGLIRGPCPHRAAGAG